MFCRISKWPQTVLNDQPRSWQPQHLTKGIMVNMLDKLSSETKRNLDSLSSNTQNPLCFHFEDHPLKEIFFREIKMSFFWVYVKKNLNQTRIVRQNHDKTYHKLVKEK